MAKRFLSLLLVVICATLHAMAQLITVKGNVVDKAAEPIIGASVTIAGTTKGTVTDIDGNFTMQADANAELTISYIGFKSKKVKVGKLSWRKRMPPSTRSSSSEPSCARVI